MPTQTHNSTVGELDVRCYNTLKCAAQQWAHSDQRSNRNTKRKRWTNRWMMTFWLNGVFVIQMLVDFQWRTERGGEKTCRADEGTTRGEPMTRSESESLCVFLCFSLVQYACYHCERSSVLRSTQRCSSDSDYFKLSLSTETISQLINKSSKTGTKMCFSLVSHCNQLNTSGIWTVGGTKQDVKTCCLGLLETGSKIFTFFHGL